MSDKHPPFFVGTKVDGLLSRAEQLFVRDKNLNDLLGHVTFTEAIFHILLGRLPTNQERQLLDLVLVAFHGGFGLYPPTTLMPRLIAGTGADVGTALAAGYLASGPYHVGAVGEAMRLYAQIWHEYQRHAPDGPKSAGDIESFADQRIAGMLQRRETVPGFGHPLVRKDPRPIRLRRILCDMQVESPYLDIYDAMVQRITAAKGVAPNIDGIAAAILLTLGFRPEHGTGLFLLARTATMLAHVVEEREELPYQTQKRFMLLPILAPGMFNADFKWWSKFFNRVRDHEPFQRFVNLIAGDAKAPFSAQEAEDLAVARRTKARRAAASAIHSSTSPSTPPAPTPETGQPAPSSMPPDHSHTEHSDEEIAADGWIEPMATAAFCLTNLLHQLRVEEKGATHMPAEMANWQRVASLLDSALTQIHQAAVLVQQQDQRFSSDGGDADDSPTGRDDPGRVPPTTAQGPHDA